MVRAIKFHSALMWHDRLDVQYFLRAVERPSVEIGIALEWNADEIRDRILRFLRQIFIFRRVARIPAACRGGRVGNAALELIVHAGLDQLNVAI